VLLKKQKRKKAKGGLETKIFKRVNHKNPF